MLLREDRRAGCDAADDRQCILFDSGVETGDADAARGAGGHFDSALAGQRFEVFLGGVRRLEAKLLGDLRAGGRVAVVFQAALDECEDLRLAGGQLGQIGRAHV